MKIEREKSRPLTVHSAEWQRNSIELLLQRFLNIESNVIDRREHFHHLFNSTCINI